jgi:hypothetical protein
MASRRKPSEAWSDLEEAVVVGTAMADRRGHRPEQAGVAAAAEAADAAHGYGIRAAEASPSPAGGPGPAGASPWVAPRRRPPGRAPARSRRPLPEQQLARHGSCASRSCSKPELLQHPGRGGIAGQAFGGDPRTPAGLSAQATSACGHLGGVAATALGAVHRIADLDRPGRCPGPP